MQRQISIKCFVSVNGTGGYKGLIWRVISSEKMGKQCYLHKENLLIFFILHGKDVARQIRCMLIIYFRCAIDYFTHNQTPIIDIKSLFT